MSNEASALIILTNNQRGIVGHISTFSDTARLALAGTNRATFLSSTTLYCKTNKCTLVLTPNRWEFVSPDCACAATHRERNKNLEEARRLYYGLD